MSNSNNKSSYIVATYSKQEEDLKKKYMLNSVSSIIEELINCIKNDRGVLYFLAFVVGSTNNPELNQILAERTKWYRRHLDMTSGDILSIITKDTMVLDKALIHALEQQSLQCIEFVLN